MADFEVIDKNLLTSVDRSADSFLIYDNSALSLKRTNINSALDLATHPVGVDDSQTLTNKALTSPTISSPVLSGTVTGTYTIGGTPTFPSTVVTTTGSQTLTNKVLISPTINNATIANPTLTVDNISEYTPGAGVTIEGSRMITAVPGTVGNSLVSDGTNWTSAIGPAISQISEGIVINGKISVTVSSNNITLALKGKDGNDPSATNPVYAMIGGTIRTITSALSVTKNAGTNWFDSGSIRLATKEIDYFAYLGYNATDGVTIGFSRIVGYQYSDFSTTSTNERYCAISTITNAAATDYYNIVGRFAATLSATAAFNWSVPTYTAVNLIQRPIYETRWLTWVPAFAASGSMQYNTVTATSALYKISYESMEIDFLCTGTVAGTPHVAIYFTTPMKAVYSSGQHKHSIACQDNGLQKSGVANMVSGTPDQVECYLYTGGNWTAGTALIGDCTKFKI